MEHLNFSYYQDDDFFIGWLADYPEYQTQGENLGELEENLRDILGDIPFIQSVS